MSAIDIRKAIEVQLDKIAKNEKTILELLEVTYNNQKRYVIKKTDIDFNVDINSKDEFIIYKGKSYTIKYYLVDDNFLDIDFELGTYEQIYNCENCGIWEPIHKINISFISNPEGKYTDRVEVCKECFKIFNYEYISSSEYIEHEKYLEKEYKRLTKMAKANNKESDEEKFDIIISEAEGKKRLIKV